MARVTAMGETILDILFCNNQPVAAVPGGSSFNSIISLGRSGRQSAFVGYTGNDEPGRQIAQFLRDNHVDTTNFEVRDGLKSAISLAYLDERGDAHYTFYKDEPCTNQPWHLPEMQRGDVLLFGSYFSICPGLRVLVNDTLEQVNRQGATLYYDINFRQSHKQEQEQLMPAIQRNMRLSSIVRGSADDFDIMFGTRDAREIYAQHVAPYCPVFICTAGEGVITVCTPAGSSDFHAPRVDDVVSTVGAGDNFNAGFIYALMGKGITAAELPTLSNAMWEQLVMMGCRFASEACRSTNNYISKEFAAQL